jgi:hypothetical protein
MKVSSRVKSTSNLILLTIRRICLRPLRKVNYHMDETQTDGIAQVSLEENALLTAEYSEDEVRKAFPNGTQQGSRSGWFSCRI